MELKTLKFEVQEGVAEIVLARKDAKNAIDVSMAKELLKIALFCDGNPDIRAVLLRGEETFCPGGDLKAFAAFGESVASYVRETTTHIHAAVVKLARMEAPLLVAVKGVAAGAGMSLALAGDFTFASESARFTMAYTKVGLVPDVSGTYFLPRAVGWKRAMELMLLNSILSAKQALEYGIVNRVVSDETLYSEARQLARQIANGPTASFAAAKRLMLQSLHTPLEAQLEAEGRAITEISHGPAAQEGIRAFLEKREPKFPK
jgi:2-(1,2-epoxy-1,2-dihydrophenyl)acetyl-CoA isomerase